MVPVGVTRAILLSSLSTTQTFPSGPEVIPPRYVLGDGRLYTASGASVGHGHSKGVRN
jgi:hypothetical protein